MEGSEMEGSEMEGEREREMGEMSQDVTKSQ